jgi:glycine/D-amino acid oxidase-like deaminating enzyme
MARRAVARVSARKVYGIIDRTTMRDPNLDARRLPPSLWAASAAPAPATEPLAEGEHAAELLVIGGGFTGLACALAAARRGADVLLVETSDVGWGASGRNNGLVIPTLTRADPDVLVAAFGPEHGEALAALLRDSADAVFDLVRTHAIDCEAVQNGWLQPAHRPSRMALARARHDQWRRRGAPVEMIDREQMAALTGSSFWHGGWLHRRGGHVNPLGLARGLARAAIGQGVRLHTRTPVDGLRAEGSGWLASAGARRIRARRVVLATAGYTGFVQPAVWPGLARTVVPTRSYQMATRPLPAALRASILPGNHAMSDTHNDLHFAHFDASGRIVTGGALIASPGWDARLRARIGARLLKLFPQWREAGAVQFEHVWHGVFASTTDRLPRFYRLGDGLLTWVGCNGRGVAFATALGPVLADAALGPDGRHPALPFESPRTIVAHGIARRVALAAIAYYRWLDGRD